MIVHRIWLGGDEPGWTRPFADTWRQPGWSVWQWTDDNIASLFPLRNQDIYDRAPQIAPHHTGQLRSDVLRYEILHRFGGVYVDTDFECLRPIDGLIEGVECFAAWEEPGRWVNNAILGCTPGHPFLDRLIDGLPRSVRLNARFKPNRMSGPRYLTNVWRRNGKGVEVFDRELFYPYSWRDVADNAPGQDFPDAYAVHHWANKRRRG